MRYLFVLMLLWSAALADTLAPEVYKSEDFNALVGLIYGKERFASIRKSARIEVIAPRHTVDDASRIEIGVRSDIKVRSVTLLRSGTGKSFIAYIRPGEMPQAMETTLEAAIPFKGTLFAVIEDENGSLYYNSTYLDIVVLGCAVSGN